MFIRIKWTFILLVWTLLIHFSSIRCPPLQTSEDNETDNNNDEVTDGLEHDPMLKLEYNKYLKEIVNVLETDPRFRQKIQNSTDEIQVARINFKNRKKNN